MDRTTGMRRLWTRGLAIGGATLLAASLAVPSAALAQDEAEAPFAPEKADLRFGYRLPSLNSVAALYAATDKGLWQECGLNSVELVLTEGVLAGVVSGFLDAGLVETVDAGQAQVDDLPVKLVAGYRPFSRNIIAVPPGIESVADLDGKDVLLGGTPGTLDFDVRAGFLAEAGYDLSTVNPNYVTVEGGSDAWVALMEEGKLFMSPVFNRHFKRLADQDFNFWVDRKDFGSDHVVANEGFLAQNPQAAAALLCGLIGGIQIWSDPANMEYILGLGEAAGIEITDNIRLAYEEDIKNYSPFDGGWDMALMEALFADVVTGEVDYADLLDLGPVHAAQEALGLEPNPPSDME